MDVESKVDEVTKLTEDIVRSCEDNNCVNKPLAKKLEDYPEGHQLELDFTGE